MKKESVNVVLKKQIKKCKPSKDEIEFINELSSIFSKELSKIAVKKRFNARVFIGGSVAKGTLIKKKEYDVDVFVRFDNEEAISEKLEMIINSVKLESDYVRNLKISRIHGSRDYFRAEVFTKKILKSLVFEVIPVVYIKKPAEMKNITDLSALHVAYVTKEIRKNSRTADEIRLAKSFCYARGCYGAESYINGLSGYALELLIIYYKSFFKLAKAIAKSKEKIVIDKEKMYKSKKDILLNINESKLQSPIILVDPTFKERNAAAALSESTFEKLKKSCIDFLKNPSEDFFDFKDRDLEEMSKDAKRRKADFVFLRAKTNRQAGDIAGSKMLKFFRMIKSEISRFYEIFDESFDYSEGKQADFCFVLKKKEKILRVGPPVNSVEHALRFRKAHKKVFILKGKVCTYEKGYERVNDFFEDFMKKNKTRMKEMGIVGFDVN